MHSTSAIHCPDKEWQERMEHSRFLLDQWINPGAFTGGQSPVIQELAQELTGSCGSPYQKAGLISLWISQNIVYDNYRDEGRAYSSVALEPEEVLECGKTVCEGYARLTQALFRAAGIPCLHIIGQNINNPDVWHAWNLAKLEGNYYYVDVTWDDRSNTDTRKDGGTEISYDYFCITTKELLRSRNISDAQLYPECTATSCNYFVRSKLFFREYDAKQVNKLLTAKLNSGAKNISFKLSSPEMLRLFNKKLIEDQGFFDIIANSDLKKKPDSIFHRKNEELNILHINLK